VVEPVRRERDLGTGDVTPDDIDVLLGEGGHDRGHRPDVML